MLMSQILNGTQRDPKKLSNDPVLSLRATTSLSLSASSGSVAISSTKMRLLPHTGRNDILGQPPRIKLPIICGQTGVGKTEIGIKVASELGGEIISADSRQIYKFMDIGTAKPTKLQRKLIIHHLLDIKHPDEDYSAGKYAKDAEKIIDEVVSKKRLPIVVGGSGLYIKALTDGLFHSPPIDLKIRNRLKQELEKRGIESLYHELRKFDPESASRINSKDRQRILRALEVFKATGIPFSQLQKTTKTNSKFIPIFIGLIRERDELKKRIELRIDKMMQSGFVDEVKRLLEKGYLLSLNSFNAVGYRELANYLKGNYSLKEALRLIKKNTDSYAKRQLTWFKKIDKINWIHLKGKDDKTEEIIRIIKK